MQEEAERPITLRSDEIPGGYTQTCRRAPKPAAAACVTDRLQQQGVITSYKNMVTSHICAAASPPRRLWEFQKK